MTVLVDPSLSAIELPISDMKLGGSELDNGMNEIAALLAQASSRSVTDTVHRLC